VEAMKDAGELVNSRSVATVGALGVSQVRMELQTPRA
jgi:hypothetical protein